MTTDEQVIRVVWGTGSGRTPAASYDAALTQANVHRYNLTHVSSVIPAGVRVEAVGTAPDLGRPGNQLVVVEARRTTTGGRVVAGLGWATSDGPGVFVEAAGTEEEAVREEIRGGLRECCARREEAFDDPVIKVVVVPASDSYETAVVVAAYGRSRSLF